MNIRRAVFLDANDIYQVETESFSTSWSYNSVKADLVNPIAYYWVATIGSKIVGYAGLWKILDEAEVTNIAVLPNFRNKKIGRSLVDTMINYCTETNINYISLEVRESNKIAINIYKSFGFIIKNIRKNYYTNPRENALIMGQQPLIKL
ncbi:ribosomal-protein-alanine N-acetyltransferase [Candidatus Epulonipiscium fishelsonii]|uniref:Ribosomal-protein-alanine N-acetyltransferase n=1 Tax=Candidatus Epulonipiscium fishelsonii TaxID=77094 RepID=A0ACC8XJH7_9FIRM|nr:ribosomal-protein-alanine N-acetyltransferase [Epulopiscium sp. SCG-D08WGA-EpuloA1]OON92209.1 MAG: ribosomal-protein-alanine N-acetyltransferase [Epulopiscium sp. AS2M-Bin002]